MVQDGKKYQIHICDDSKEHAYELKNTLMSLSEEFPSLVTFSFTEEELFSRLQFWTECEEEIPDIIFLDIRMPQNDGIALGKMIKERLPHVFLVFVTAYAEYAVKGYEAKAFRYLLKPVTGETLKNLFVAIQEENIGTKKLIIKEKKSSTSVFLRDILYISAEDKYAIVYTKNNHYISDVSLIQYEEQLREYGFFRIHRKYLLNVFHHKKINGNKIQISDGTVITVSKKKISTYEKFLFDYLRRDFV